MECSGLKRIIGIDIGRKKCSVIHADFDGNGFRILQKVIFLLEADYNTAELAIERLDELLHMYDFEAIGISCSGPLDSKNGVLISPQYLPGWSNLRLKEHFEEKFGVPCQLHHDVNACALAEWKLGAGKGMENLVYLTFGTELDSGLILNGKLYIGANDMAGEIGQIRLSKHATADDFCSSDGIRKLTFKKLDELKELGIEHPLQKKGNYLSAFDVFEAAKQGDKLAMQIIRTSAEKLGHLIACIADFLNPEAVIIGNYYARNAEVLLPIIREVVDREANPISSTLKILPSKLGDSIWDLGALMCAL